MTANLLPPSLDAFSPRSVSSYFLANPYSTPVAELRTRDGSSDEIQLASRGSRLGAVLIDYIIFNIIIVFIAFIVILFILGAQGSEIENTVLELFEFMFPRNVSETSINLLNIFVYLQIILPLGLYTLVNGYLLSKRGQSIGKMLLNISIRDNDSMEVPPLSRIILRRYLVKDSVQLINIPLYFIVDLVDILSIFRQDKRMIHDLIANTVVVQLPRNQRVARRSSV